MGSGLAEKVYAYMVYVSKIFKVSEMNSVVSEEYAGIFF